MFDLREIRINAGMTQDQLAEKVGVIRQTISNIECGISKPSVSTAQAIAQVLEFDWTLFFAD